MASPHRGATPKTATADRRIKVIFACQDCGRPYSACQEPIAFQERSKASGRFDCTKCRATVHAWSGAYHFSEWSPL